MNMFMFRDTKNYTDMYTGTDTNNDMGIDTHMDTDMDMEQLYVGMDTFFIDRDIGIILEFVSPNSKIEDLFQLFLEAN
jgi:hypothetical protein